ncbi:MAG: DUF937 domain-containing protein [Chitinophagaceae bacterium]
MENVTQLLLSQIGEDGLENLASKAGAGKVQVTQAMESAVPTLLNAISTNTRSTSGANNFLDALDRDHDGSILDNINGHLQNPAKANGTGILKHVLGKNRSAVENQLSGQSGLSSGSIGNIMEMVAPLLMGFLGRQKKQINSVFSPDKISGVMSSLGGGKGIDMSELMNMAEDNTNLNGGGLLRKMRHLASKN